MGTIKTGADCWRLGYMHMSSTTFILCGWMSRSHSLWPRCKGVGSVPRPERPLQGHGWGKGASVRGRGAGAVAWGCRLQSAGTSWPDGSSTGTRRHVGVWPSPPQHKCHLWSNAKRWSFNGWKISVKLSLPYIQFHTYWLNKSGAAIKEKQNDGDSGVIF